MKLSLTFLALAVATVQADLTSKWNLDFGVAGQTGDIYTFTYLNIGDEMLVGNMQATVYDGACDAAGVTYATNVAGVASGLTTPVEAMTLTYVTGAANTGVASLGVDMNTKVAAATDLWLAQGTDGGGTLSFCVRMGLFAGTNEINFSETVVTLVITMEGGFAVEAFDVAEKDRTASDQDQAYTVTAALCSTGGGAAGNFEQGSLICVQVNPSSTDVEVTSITTFGWTNSAPVDPVTQSALPLAGGDGLSSYDPLIPDTFSTILYAQFYESGIAVTGSGTATLGFTSGRRLGSGSDNGRVLQEVDAVQDFDIVADIVKSDDSPTALQTAGGATASFVVTIVGLVGAVLLA